MEQLKDFMLVFRMQINPDHRPSAEELASMKQAWGRWIGGIAQQARLISSHQLGFEGNVILSNAEVRSGYHKGSSGSLSGYLLLKAEHLEEAAEFAIDCPILTMGGTVEVRNTLNVF